MTGQLYLAGNAYEYPTTTIELVGGVLTLSEENWGSVVIVGAETGTSDTLDTINLGFHTDSGINYSRQIILIAASTHTITVSSAGNITPSTTPLSFTDTNPLHLMYSGVTNGYVDSLHASTSGLLANGVEMDKVGTPTYSNVQDMQNIFHSTGWVTGGVIADAGSEQITVTQGSAFFRDSVDPLDTLRFADFANLTATSIPTDSTRYVGVQMVASVVTVVIRTAVDWDYLTDFPLGLVTNEAGTLHITNTPFQVGDHASLMVQRAIEIHPFAIPAGNPPVLSSIPTRNLSVTASVVWIGLTRLVLDAINTTGADTFDLYYETTGVFTKSTGNTQWPNTQYNDTSSGLVTMAANRYANIFFWEDIESNGDLVAMYGQAEFTSVSLASEESIPASLPLRLISQGLFIGQLIFQKSNDTAIAVLVPFIDELTASGATDHATLANLAVGDDHPQYQLVAGRADEQQTWIDSITTPPWKVTSRSAAPTDTPVTGDVYVDDGTNTDSGKPASRHYNGSSYDDLGANTDNLNWIDQAIVADATALQQMSLYTPISPPSNSDGDVFYTDLDAVPSFQTPYTGVVVKIGNHVLIKVYNDTGVLIPKMSVVTPFGSTGNYPNIELSDTSTLDDVLGVVPVDIAIGAYGIVVIAGPIYNLQTGSFSVGNILYLSGTVDGTLTTTLPTKPERHIICARVDVANAGAGIIQVSINKIPTLLELSDVDVSSLLDGHAVIWDSSAQTFVNSLVSIVSSQAGVPSSTPSRLGEMNIDTTNDDAYVSTDTASSADWNKITA